MPAKTVTTLIYICSRCAHEWTARTAGKPIYCPHCHSKKWDEPKKTKIEGQK